MTTTIGSVSQRPALLHVYPDTQHETENAKDMLDDMVTFSIARAPDLVLFVGDLTNSKTVAEWSFLQYELGRLTTAGVKWLVVPGNHDSNGSDRTTLMNNYLTAGAWVTGAMDAGRLENTYTIVTIGGRQCLVLCLEFSPRTATVAWANSVVAANPGAWTILVTHCYMCSDGHRYDWAVYGNTQHDSPYSASYQWTPAQGISDGQDLWNNLVSLHSNVRLVLSGHDFLLSTGVGNCRLTSTRLGTTCNQLLQDYQGFAAPGGTMGAGIMRELFLDFTNNKLNCRTYSPYQKTVYDSPNENFYLDT
jgi:3',5'-cyclic AMP phosphodiesterase CpdA